MSNLKNNKMKKKIINVRLVHRMYPDCWFLWINNSCVGIERNQALQIANEFEQSAQHSDTHNHRFIRELKK